MRKHFIFSLVLSACAGLGLSGCAKQGDDPAAQKNSSAAESKDSHDDHDHPAHGPHDGHLIELGHGKYHAELTHDDKAHIVGIYLLDGKAKELITVPQKELTVNVSYGEGQVGSFVLIGENSESAGNSYFQIVSEELIHLLGDEPTLKGRFNLMIDGVPYVGEITHDSHDHDHHGHSH